MYSFFLSSSCIDPPPIQDLHPSPELTTQIPVGQMPVEGIIVYGPEHQTDTQARASLNVWSAQCQGLRRRQQRTEHRQRTHPIPRQDPAVQEGRDSTDTSQRRIKKVPYYKVIFTIYYITRFESQENSLFHKLMQCCTIFQNQYNKINIRSFLITFL